MRKVILVGSGIAALIFLSALPVRAQAPAQTAAPVGKSAVIETQELPPVEKSPEEEESRLTKNWGGARQRLSERGIDLGVIYKGEVSSNLSGGVQKKTGFLGNLDLRIALDGEKIGGWKGGSAFIYVIADHGSDPSEYVGDAQGTSNIEAPANTVKLYEAWVQQLFAEDGVSLLVGLHDLNSEFYVTETSGLFFNGSFGVGRELSQTGVNGPSIFPVTSAAIRLRAETARSFNIQVAAFEAVAGNPDEPRGTHVRLKANDGQLLISEVAYLRGKDDGKEGAAKEETKALPGKYAIGTWAYTSTFDHQTATNDGGATPVRAPSHGTYFLADQALCESLSVFARFGFASTEANRFGSDLGGGAVYTGLIPGRPKDRLGLAFTRVQNGSEYKAAQELAGAPSRSAETTWELTYRVEVVPGIAVQPDLQYVVDPNTDPAVSNALVGGARIELNF